jgi:phenylacetic acid degradation operon negative regulatory protein
MFPVHARLRPSRRGSGAANRTTSARERIARWIERELRRHPPRAKSLVVTVWGDALAPHGGAVWLGSLIRLLAPLGLNERLVRTSVYRLAQEGWVEAKQTGRRSLYRLTASGRQRFEHAYRRIYAPPAAVWDGTWEIVMAPAAALASAQRERLKRELGWEGFGAIASGMFVRPAHNHHAPDLAELLRALRVEKKVVVLRASDAPGLDVRSLRQYAQDAWNLERVASEYRGFLARFRVIAEHLRAARTVDTEQAFVVRTLLIHAFRRVTLHDPQLPNEIAPPAWPAMHAYALCRDLYRLLQRSAEEQLAATYESGNGALPPTAPYFHQRFGGL